VPASSPTPLTRGTRVRHVRLVTEQGTVTRSSAAAVHVRWDSSGLVEPMHPEDVEATR
jgi:hypothetical protein